MNNALVQMDALIRDEIYNKFYINGLIENIKGFINFCVMVDEKEKEAIIKIPED